MLDRIQEAVSIRDLLEWGSDFLKRHDIEHPRRDAENILGHLLGLNRINLYLSEKESLSPRQLSDYQDLIQKRSSRVPLQYVMGKAAFLDDEFLVDGRVLIPRPETELLVEEARRRLADVRTPSIVDIGTGCGNIAISLVKSLGGKVWATEISQEALVVAESNAKGLGVAHQVTFLRGDLFAPLKGLGLEDTIDLVISNPPYVTRKELAKVAPEIRYEPRMALDGGEDGLDSYRRIIPESLPFLKKGGRLLLELGDALAEKVAALVRMQEAFGKSELLEDLAGIQRILAARKK